MAKKDFTAELYSYGIYSRWDKNSKKLPKLQEITNKIPLELDIEFGYILIIKGAKGKRLLFKIDHPSFPDKKGKIAPPYTGEYTIRSNTYEFFLGDTIWEPISDKKGAWTLTTWLEGKIIAEKSFLVG